MPHSGQCMCGTIQFSFEGEPRFVGECVCESCRQAHGASVVGWVGVKTEHFKIAAGMDALKWYQSSPASQRGFCTECGTRILFKSDKWPGEMHMALACINTPHNLKAKGIGFKEELPQWTSIHLPDDN